MTQHLLDPYMHRISKPVLEARWFSVFLGHEAGFLLKSQFVPFGHSSFYFN